ncbi:8-oxo-dGDP phosphatase NUDT18 [Striga asiatica]|uniref:8-oxo-dGDP phosphatase NUDT18 n=1 Tax=Striga asiatica TaxID=4170 RepID=A0A5A7QDF8_STRAF|nr:8-oxo-dGDP phosphatase NUDT18 [Striga asiatica]
MRHSRASRLQKRSPGFESPTIQHTTHLFSKYHRQLRRTPSTCLLNPPLLQRPVTDDGKLAPPPELPSSPMPATKPAAFSSHEDCWPEEATRTTPHTDLTSAPMTRSGSLRMAGWGFSDNFQGSENSTFKLVSTGHSVHGQARFGSLNRLGQSGAAASMVLVG